MLATIIQDAYKENEAEKLAEGIDYLCSPNDNYGWASAGVYCFWDFYSRNILYIGLAVDLAHRFKQHNGLTPCNDKACKVREIEKYFQTNGILGYSICVQSTLDQPIIQKNKNQFKEEIIEEEENNGSFTQMSKERIKLQEGALIEICRQSYGTIPPWNKYQGSRHGRKRIKQDHAEFLKSLSGGDSLLVAKSTIREIAGNPTLERYENMILHACRIMMLGRPEVDKWYYDIMHGIPCLFLHGTLEEAISKLSPSSEVFVESIKEMRANGYLARKGPFS